LIVVFADEEYGEEDALATVAGEGQTMSSIRRGVGGREKGSFVEEKGAAGTGRCRLRCPFGI
jgi:hypothetical protein